MIFEVLAIGFVCMACFLLGAKVGSKTEIRNPVEVVQERKEKREAKMEAKAEQDRIAIIMQNIEGYDGTSYGQKDVPRG